MANADVLDLGSLDIELYKCITEQIDTDKVIISGKQLLHMEDHHPEAYEETLIELKSTIQTPDYIFRDDKHEHTGLVVRQLNDNSGVHIVLRICTDSQGGNLANSVISGWKISEKRVTIHGLAFSCFSALQVVERFFQWGKIVIIRSFNHYFA